jgi:ABC-type polysaccharide/polyol phosphate export permease
VSATLSRESPGMGIRLGWLRDHGDLLRTLLRRELRAKYKGSALGVAWSYIYPLLMMAVYTVVFSVLWDSGIPHYPLVVLTGLTAWSFFQSAVYGGATSIVSNAQIIKKVWFPREIVPIAVVLAAGVSSLVMIAVLIPVDLWFAPESRSPAMLLAIPIGLCFFALAAGFAWLLAAANVFFRDVEHFLSVLFLPWFFLTPVFYRLEGLPGADDHQVLIQILRWGNPVTPYVEGLRAALLDGVVPGTFALVYMAVVGPLFLLVGLWVVQRYEDRFAVVL